MKDMIPLKNIIALNTVSFFVATAYSSTIISLEAH